MTRSGRRNLRPTANWVATVPDSRLRPPERVGETETTKLLDDAIEAVEDEPGSGTPYEQWTKAELVERAKELKIVGPTRMSKAELIDTLRAAS